MCLEGRLCVLAVWRNGFVENAATAVIQPIGAHFLIAVVQEFHGGMHVALHGTQVTFVTARAGGILPSMTFVLVAVFMAVAMLIHALFTALLMLIDFLIDLLKRVSRVGCASKGECGDETQNHQGLFGLELHGVLSF